MGRSIALVTGSSGFIGRHLAARLAGSGVEVRRLVRMQSGISLPAGCVGGDYHTGAGLREAVAGADVVFHLAGVTKALRRADYYSGNVEAAGNMARAAGDGPRFVHVSSLAAVGPSTAGADVTEETEPHPVSDYGASKLAGEQAVRRLLPGAVVVRPPVVYGPYDTDVFQMLRTVARGFDVRIGRAERWFSAIYVADLVEGLMAAGCCPGAAGKAYFLAHPEPVSWTAFTASAARLLDCRPRRIVLPRAAAMAAGWCAETWSRVSGKPGILSRDKVREAAYPRWTCSAGRAGRELGFTASTPLDQGLAAALAWYKEQEMALGATSRTSYLKLAPTDRWWPVDLIIIAYLIYTGILVAIWFPSIQESWWLLPLHVGAVLALRVFRSNETFHSWYPLLFVAACYKEMAMMIPAIRGVDFDAWAAGVDASFWTVNPTAWLAARQLPALTEFLQVCYTLFLPAVLGLAGILWMQKKAAEFRFYAFVLALGFLASYLGYLAVPVRGPRFLEQGLPPLRGLWFTPIMQQALDKLESAHFDCFPSGHTELTILACWGSRMASRKLHYLFWVYTPCIIFATVYLRYHYTIDVLAGALLAFVLIAVAPHIFTILGKRGH